MKWYQPRWWVSDKRWFYIERPFPSPLICAVVAAVALAVILVSTVVHVLS